MEERLRFSTCAIASVHAIRGWCHCRCAAYLTALQSAAICWVACTCNIHPTVGALAAPPAWYYGTDPVMETQPGFSITPESLAPPLPPPPPIPVIVRVMLRGLTMSCYIPETRRAASATIISSQSIKLARPGVSLCYAPGKTLGPRIWSLSLSSFRAFRGFSGANTLRRTV